MVSTWNQTNPSNRRNAFSAQNDLLLNWLASWNCLQMLVYCMQQNMSRCGCRALCMAIVIVSHRPTQFQIQENYSRLSAAKPTNAIVCQWVMKMNRRQLLSLFNHCHALNMFCNFHRHHIHERCVCVFSISMFCTELSHRQFPICQKILRWNCVYVRSLSSDCQVWIKQKPKTTHLQNDF